MKCGRKCEVYSRVCGYHRPVRAWNKGKREEFKQRRLFDVECSGSGRPPKSAVNLIPVGFDLPGPDFL